MFQPKRFKFFSMFMLLFISQPVFAQDEAAAIPVENGTLAILISLAALIITLFKNRERADDTLVKYFQQQQRERDQMATLERAYQQFMFKSMFDLAATGVRTFAPMTPFKADDELANYMQDIQQPGSPSTPVPPAPPVNK